MLAELETLLDVASPEMEMPDYRRLVVQENVLAKPTHTTREHTVRKLKAVYGLDPKIAVFRIMRKLWDIDPAARPLLAMLCAQARDPLLRMASPAVVTAATGSAVLSETIIDLIDGQAPDRFSEKNLKAIASRILSSFRQSGHLVGRTEKVRTRADVTPASATYAFTLAYLEGYRARRIFTSPWSVLLDATPEALGDLAQAASRRGLCDFRQMGDIIELRFPELLTRDEEELTRVGQD